MAAEAEPAVKASLREALGISATSDDTLVITLAAPNLTFLQKIALVAGARRRDLRIRHQMDRSRKLRGKRPVYPLRVGPPRPHHPGGEPHLLGPCT